MGHDDKEMPEHYKKAKQEAGPKHEHYVDEMYELVKNAPADQREALVRAQLKKNFNELIDSDASLDEVAKQVKFTLDKLHKIQEAIKHGVVK